MKKLFVMLIITLASLIVLDVVLVDDIINTDKKTDHTDNALYIERAQAILDGKILYRDVDTHTPPLINYLLIPPVLFGGGALAFEIYFSIFIALTVLSLYYFLFPLHNRFAYISSLTFLLFPTTLATPTFARQDESIIVFFFMLPLLLLYDRKRLEMYSLISTIGVWLKMHSIFLVPPFLLQRKRQDILKHLAIIGGVSLAVITPFLILAFDETVWFFRFYLLGEGEELQGISLWRILDSQGYTVPNIALIVTLAIAVVFIYMKWAHASLWKCILLSMIAYFVLYPKIHYEYYVLLFALAIPYMIENKNHIKTLFSISLVTSLVLLIEQRYLDWHTENYESTIFIIIAFLCMLFVNMSLIYLFYHYAKKTDTWIETKKPEERHLFHSNNSQEERTI